MDSGGRLFKLSERPDTRHASGAHEALGYHERNWVAASLPLHAALTEEALRETHLAHFVGAPQYTLTLTLTLTPTPTLTLTLTLTRRAAVHPHAQ